MTEPFKLETFSPHLNSIFSTGTEAQGGPVDLELVEATDIGSTARQEQFSLMFRGPLDKFVTQGTYSVRHEELGSFSIFLVPIKKGEDGYYYEAAFNRML